MSPPNIPEPSTARTWALLAAALAAALLLSYAPARDGEFLYDDLSSIIENPRLAAAVSGRTSILSLLLPAADHRRPLPLFTFALNLRWFGNGARSFHLFNLGLHFLNGLLLLALARGISRALSGREPPFAPLAFGALLWALQPAHTQAVTYIVQRMTLMAALFSLLCLLLWVEAGGRAGARRAGLYAASGLAAALALLCKESAACLPLAVLLWEYFSPRRSRRRLVALTAAVAALYLAGALLLLHSSSGELSGYAPRFGSLADRLRSQPRVIWHYLSLLAFPHPARLAMEGRWNLSTGLLSPPSTFIAGVGLLLLLAVLAVLVRWRGPLALGLCFFFIALLPESGFWPIGLQADHRLYLPSSLLLAGLGAAAGAEGRLCRVRRSLLALALALLCLLTMSRNRDWRTETGLYRDSIRKSPDSFIAWKNYADLQLRRGSLASSLLALRRTLVLNPGSYMARLSQAYVYLLLNRLPLFRAMPQDGAACATAASMAAVEAEAALALAECEAGEGRTDEALGLARRAARLGASEELVLWFLAWDLAAAGRHDQAHRLVASAEAGRPDYARLLQRGQLALAAGDEAAAEIYRRALELRPRQTEALMGMGLALEKTDPLRAAGYYRRARQVEPALALVTDALCGALAAAGESQAETTCALARNQDPLLAPAWKSLGRDLYERGEAAKAADCLRHALALAPGDREIEQLLILAREESAP